MNNIKNRLTALGIIVTLSMLIFSPVTIAHSNVVVVPLGGDEPPEVRAGSEIYTNSIGMKFSLIPAGSFIMGSPAGTGDATHRPYWPAEGGRTSNEHQHVVTLSEDFYMQTTEVTQAQYEQVMGTNPAYFSASGAGADCGSDCPVETVSWNDAQNFIDALNASENRRNCNTHPNTCYLLPTESQWEYAARGTTNSAFYNGDITQPTGNDPNLDLIGWYTENSSSTTHPVALKAANHWGLYDMSGNVFEWCEDWFGTYPNGPVTNPIGAGSGSFRVIRGGSWHLIAGFSRLAFRNWSSPGDRLFALGFRLALPPG